MDSKVNCSMQQIMMAHYRWINRNAGSRLCWQKPYQKESFTYKVGMIRHEVELDESFRCNAQEDCLIDWERIISQKAWFPVAGLFFEKELQGLASALANEQVPCERLVFWWLSWKATQLESYGFQIRKLGLCTNLFIKCSKQGNHF